MSRVWCLDVFVRDGMPMLFVSEPAIAMIEAEPLAGWALEHAVSALRTVLMRTAPNWPSTIVTDAGRLFSGIGAAVGIAQEYTSYTDQRRLERLERSL